MFSRLAVHVILEGFTTAAALPKPADRTTTSNGRGIWMNGATAETYDLGRLRAGQMIYDASAGRCFLMDPDGACFVSEPFGPWRALTRLS